jgi:phasin family protein
MLNSTEQLATAARKQLDAQLQLATSVAGSMISGMEKFAGLNLQAARASVEASIGSVQNLLAAKDPQEFFSTAYNQSQPQTDIALTYGRHLSSIASGTQQELSRVAESQITANSRQLVSLLDDLTRVAPAGSETALTMMKSAIDNVSSSYAQLNKSAKVAIDAMESNMQAASARIAASRN